MSVLEIVISFVDLAPPSGTSHHKCHPPSKLAGWRLGDMKKSWSQFSIFNGLKCTSPPEYGVTKCYEDLL